MLSLASNDIHEKTKDRIIQVAPYAQLVAKYIHETVQRIVAKEDAGLAPIALTVREKECLMWAAEGKTSWETSQILNISERTVVFHLGNAARKLNVANRPQAVARAISQRLITPQIV